MDVRYVLLSLIFPCLLLGTAAGAGAAGITLRVDSSLVGFQGKGQVQVFAGSTAPGPDSRPLAQWPVRQEENGCGWGVPAASLPPGEYTAVPVRGDRPLPALATPFTVVPDGARVELRPSRILRVGPAGDYATVAEAAAASRDGDVIEIAAGTYRNDIVVWRRDDLTIRGVGGWARMESTRPIRHRRGSDRDNGKAIWVMQGDRVRVEHVEFTGAAVEGGRNGAGIRMEGRDLVLCHTWFHDNQNGILGGKGDLLVEYSIFEGSGRAHNIYVGRKVDRFVLRHSVSRFAVRGHNVKSRARENYILYNRIMDEREGRASYAVDLPEGGLAFVVGNLLQQGPRRENWTLLAYGAEGLRKDSIHRLHLSHNTFVSDRPGGNMVRIWGSPERVLVVNNLFVGRASRFRGATVEEAGNLATEQPGFVDRDRFDYRLTAASPAIDGGVPLPGVEGGSLVPHRQYREPAAREPRPTVGAPDVGAYEFRAPAASGD